MSNFLISQVCDKQVSNRDLLVDEINDEIEAGSLSENEILLISNKLLNLLSNELDQAVHESIMNLLSGLYPRGYCTQEIEKYVLTYINELHSSSLIHALSIVSESSLEEREKILSDFSESKNEVVQRVAKEYLSEI